MIDDMTLDRRIDAELSHLADRTPPAVSPERIAAAGRNLDPVPVSRARFVVGVAAVVVALAGGLALLAGGSEERRGTTRAAAAAPEVVERATDVDAADFDSTFIDTVGWPHVLLDDDLVGDRGWELLAVDEIRPGLAGAEAPTVQTFTVGGTDGEDAVVRLEIHPGGGRSNDEGGFDLAGHRLLYADWDHPDEASREAWWEWPTARVHIRALDVDRAELEPMLAAMTARDDDPLSGFDPGPGVDLVAERTASEGAVEVPVVWAWYGTGIGDPGRDSIDVAVQIQAVGPPATVNDLDDLDELRDLRLVDFHGDGGRIEQIAGRSVVVAEDGPYTSAAWYGDDGELLTLQVRDLGADGGRSRLGELVESVQRVDSGDWTRAVDGLSDRIAARPATATTRIGDVELIARQGFVDVNGDTWSHVCLTAPGRPEACRANPLLRDGGPSVITPFGTVTWPQISVGSHVFSAVIDGTWWVARFHEAGPTDRATRIEPSTDPVTETEPVAEPWLMAADPTGVWEVVAIPPHLDRVELVAAGHDHLGRPSS